MRWPNRRPHRLTDGMRAAQAALSRFMPAIDWLSFRRVAIDAQVTSPAALHVTACGDDRQALVYLLRTDALNERGMVDRSAAPVSATLSIPGLKPGRYRATAWDTAAGEPAARLEGASQHGALTLALPPFAADLALAVRPIQG
jgi:mannan endo-1,4-beta-mannosidase